MEYFNTHERTFPINPFHVLTDLGIHFVFRNFKDIEGLFLPAMKDGDVDLVAINAKGPLPGSALLLHMNSAII